MFTVTPNDPKDGDTLELVDTDARTLVAIEPSRGAIATRFRAGDHELFYMDESTLRDRTKNVRGGNPVLFPTPGKLDGDHWSYGGHAGALKQHGFARTEAWRVSKVATAGAAEVHLELSSNDVTRAGYPWDFRVTMTYALRGARLRIDHRVENRSAEAMPFGFGFHPYFAIGDKARARISTRATRAYDNVQKRDVPFTGFDLTQKEVDLHLLDHGSHESVLDRGDGTKIAIRASEDYVRWVIWTLEGKGFVCVEPWTAPGNALNTGASLITLAPGAARDLWIEIEALG
jgi:galactose mutarotase-like enzyme